MTDGEGMIIVERRIDAPPDVVYGYLTDSVRWARWQGVSAEIEAVAGGKFQMTMANGMVAEGRFVELVPSQRVAFTWGWHGSALGPGSTTVIIDLAADRDGTLLTLTHEGLPPGDVPFHRIGWDHYVPRLAVAAEGRDPGSDPGP
jgi:uncharacterized protein YndB with AHSA1/START domain